MSTASAVPETQGELEGDEALETLREAGGRRLVADSITRFRAADGFSHSRALAFQATLTLLPALIAVVGLAATLDQETFTRVVTATVDDLAPGAAGEILTEALRHGSASARKESGETAVVAGFIAAMLAGATAMAQIERGANRIYGVERDRPFLRKYAVAAVLTFSAGVGALLSLVLLVGGEAIREEVGWGKGLDTAWAIARWPLGLAFAISSVALLLRLAPRRRQPDWSWLAFGAAASAVLWRFAAAVALFLGLAFSAQLEAVRAGVPQPRVDRDANA
jgi:YihY family inner membrane protein